jgi:hypothetical protein
VLQLIYFAEILTLGVVGVLVLRAGANGWETIGAISAIAATACWLVAFVAWHTVDAGKTLVVIGVLISPLAAPLIYGVSRRLLSRRWRRGGTALAVCWALGGVGILSAFPLLAVLSIPAFAFLPFWAVRVSTEIGREPPQPVTPLAAQN